MRHRRRILVILISVVVAAGGGWWWFREPLAAWLAGMAGKTRQVVAGPRPDPKTYASLVGELARWRAELAKRHRAAKNAEQRSAVEHDARVILEQALPAMMRCWLGTPWDFNGTAAKPGGGKIACGYFVSTVLMDAGFQVDRYRLAQQPSGNILRTFLEKNDCHLTTGQPYAAFADAVATSEHGIWLLGLDTHVAFLVVDERGFRMIHSSGSRPWCVVDESRDQAVVLQRSNWRMTGNLTASTDVIRRWLKGAAIPVHGAS
jgi:hypothetical protein